jgi:hypothetical protein
MSADNFIGIGKDSEGYFVSHGFMSPYEDDCQYKGQIISRHKTDDEASIAAIKAAREETILEYGVISLVGDFSEKDYCGSCFVCINDRNIVNDETVEICASCNQPIYGYDWRVMNNEGTFHKDCERR